MDRQVSRAGAGGTRYHAVTGLVSLLVAGRAGEKSQLEVAGMFYGIGHTPNSKLISQHVELDESGYVKVKHGVSTSLPGVFAAGDLQDTEWRQVRVVWSVCDPAERCLRSRLRGGFFYADAYLTCTHKGALIALA